MNTVEKFEARQAESLSAEKNIPDFSPGDTLRVNVRVREGTRERVQAFEGVCIGREGKGIGGSFTVRKISYGEGVERVFPLLSPRIDSIELIRRGAVRRAKLYYLRDRRGKSARIAERTTGHGIPKRGEDHKKAVKDAGVAKSEVEKGHEKAEKQAGKKAKKAKS